MRAKKRPIKSIAYEILKMLATGVALYFVLSSPSGTRRVLKGVLKELQQRRATQEIDRLKRRKLISYRSARDGKIDIELTDAGRKKFLVYAVEEIAPEIPRRWDNKWRIIFSDIPESHKKARDALRQKFLTWGFYPLQKSVFVYPYPCEDEIAIVRDVFHVSTSNLLMVVTDQVGNHRALKKFFGLS